MASGQAHAASDIDVMIVSDSLSLEEVFAALGPIEDALGRHLNPTLYTRREFDKRLAARNAFLTKVMARPRIALIEGQDGTA